MYGVERRKVLVFSHSFLPTLTSGIVNHDLSSISFIFARQPGSLRTFAPSSGISISTDVTFGNVPSGGVLDVLRIY